MDDAYWDAFRLLTGAQQAYDRARALLGPARQAAAAAHAQSATLATAAAAADGSAAASHLALDRLVVDLYQYGPPITAASALLGAPEDFLQQVDTAHNQDVAAGLVVGQANASANAAALARVRALAAGQRASAADALLAAAESGAARARADLAAATSALGGLAVSAPQARVGPDGCPTADVAGTLRGGAEADRGRAAVPGRGRSRRDTPGRPGSDLGLRAPGGRVRVRRGRADAPVAHGLLVAGVPGVPRGRRSRRGRQHLGALDPRHGAVGRGHARPALRGVATAGTAARRPRAVRHRRRDLPARGRSTSGPPRRAAQAWMLHTNACGDVAKVEPFWGFPATGSHTFLGARRVLRLPTRPQEARDGSPRRTMTGWSRLSESNRRPSLYKSDALTS